MNGGEGGVIELDQVKVEAGLLDLSSALQTSESLGHASPWVSLSSTSDTIAKKRPRSLRSTPRFLLLSLHHRLTRFQPSSRTSPQVCAGELKTSHRKRGKPKAIFPTNARLIAAELVLLSSSRAASTAR